MIKSALIWTTYIVFLISCWINIESWLYFAAARVRSEREKKEEEEQEEEEEEEEEEEQGEEEKEVQHRY